MSKKPRHEDIPTAKDAYAIARRIMDRVDELQAGKTDASELATIANKMIMVGAELRKAEAAEAKLADIPPAVLLERIRKMAPHERANLLAEITAMDRKGSVL